MDIETKVVIGGILFRSMYNIQKDVKCKSCRKKILRNIKKVLSIFRNDVPADKWIIEARNKRYVELMELTTVIMNRAHKEAIIGNRQVVMMDPYNLIKHLTKLYPAEMNEFNIDINHFIELQKCYENSKLTLHTITYVNRLHDQIEYFKKRNYKND